MDALGGAFAPTFARFDERCERLKDLVSNLVEGSADLREDGSQPSGSAPGSRSNHTIGTTLSAADAANALKAAKPAEASDKGGKFSGGWKESASGADDS